MGFFGSLISGVTGLISGGKNRKAAVRAQQSAERLAKLQMQANLSQQQHEIKLSNLNSRNQKNNKPSFIPWVVGGAISLIGIVVAVLTKTKKRR
jgi:hypothetical protein